MPQKTVRAICNRHTLCTCFRGPARAGVLPSSAFLLLKTFGCALEPLCLAPRAERQPHQVLTRLGDFCARYWEREESWSSAQPTPGGFTLCLTQVTNRCCGVRAEAWHFTCTDRRRPGKAGPPSPFGVDTPPPLSSSANPSARAGGCTSPPDSAIGQQSPAPH